MILISPDMSLVLAERLLAGVRTAAATHGVTLAAAVVDRGGNPVASARMDGAQLGAARLALDKAFTAVAFGQPTAAWSESTAPGGSDWGLGTSLGGRVVVFPGGLPVVVNGALVGGLGVSGSASEVDAACAEAALNGAVAQFAVAESAIVATPGAEGHQ